MELAKMTVMNTLIGAVEEAVGVYTGIMRDPTEKATDRIKAADRVLEIAGIKTGQPLVQVQVNTGLRPQEDSRDARLMAIIEKNNKDRAELLRQRAIEATVTDVA